MEISICKSSLSIRPMSVDRDSFLCFLAKSNPDVLQYLESNSSPFSSPLDASQWMINKLKSDDDYLLAITLNDYFIGHVGVYSITGPYPELGILIGFSQFWGHGIASYIIPIFIDFLQPYSFPQLYIRVKHDNFSALHVYKKVGFKEFQVLDDNYLMLVYDL